MPLLLTPTDDRPFTVSASYERRSFVFVGERLWLDFVNTEFGPTGEDGFRTFESLLQWLEAAEVLDEERGAGIRRRAAEQLSAAHAALVEAKRVRGTLRLLAERGIADEEAQRVGLFEINRILGRSAVTRRIDLRSDGTFARSFSLNGDAFAGLVIPVVESAADALILGELSRVRVCGAIRCQRVFFDTTKNGRRRWCDMATCGNRAKAARHREKMRAS